MTDFIFTAFVVLTGLAYFFATVEAYREHRRANQPTKYPDAPAGAIRWYASLADCHSKLQSGRSVTASNFKIRR